MPDENAPLAPEIPNAEIPGENQTPAPAAAAPAPPKPPKVKRGRSVADIILGNEGDE